MGAGLIVLGVVGCYTDGDAAADGSGEEEASQEVVLGPADGLDLPPVDLERVKVGDLAPDFTAVAHTGEALTLSDFRGRQNVVLFFYRGHW